MDTLELIRTAHLVDQYLERLASAVADEALKKNILTVQAEWQTIAYTLTRLACGIEASMGTPKKRAVRKRSEDASGRMDETPSAETREQP